MLTSANFGGSDPKTIDISPEAKPLRPAVSLGQISKQVLA